MTKFANIAAVLAVVLTLAACAQGQAQRESVVNGDRTFNSAQSK